MLQSYRVTNPNTFTHSCKVCRFSTPVKKWLDRHICKGTRDKIHSQVSVGPPTQLSSHADSPSSPCNSLPTAVDTSFTTHHAQVSPQALNGECSSSGNQPSQVDEEVGHVQGIPQLKPGYCRISGEVHFPFPIHDFLSCTEPGCGMSFYCSE